ncbi:hypothetical protein J5N97_001875 [Dioscorea zingiberensis]|uniref:CCHC-type domain-containing protein n=1 Tax=Dioscorea zingiberensis TaxID=325984 RepID=A0A9D5H235_9LILI|nr:hypothetical protein J5N97_001875 [Dioscorea zingiberensis]
MVCGQCLKPGHRADSCRRAITCRRCWSTGYRARECKSKPTKVSSTTGMKEERGSGLGEGGGRPTVGIRISEPHRRGEKERTGPATKQDLDRTRPVTDRRGFVNDGLTGAPPSRGRPESVHTDLEEVEEHVSLGEEISHATPVPPQAACVTDQPESHARSGEGLQTHGNTEAHVTCSAATHRVQSSSDERRGAYDGTIQKSDGGDSKRTNGKDGRGSVAGIPKLLSQVRLVSLAASNTYTSKNTWRPKPLALHGTRSHLTGHSIFKAKKENQGHVSLLKHIQASNEKEDENIAKWQAGKAHVMLVNNENGGVFSNIKDNEDVNIKIKVNDELNGNTKKQLTAYSNPGKRINEDGEIVDDFIDKRLEREIDMEMQEMGKAQLSVDGSMQAKDPVDITSEDVSEGTNLITPSNDSYGGSRDLS